MEFRMMNKSVRRREARKKKFIKLYKQSFGNINYCCQQIGISRASFYVWRNNDLDFRKRIQQIQCQQDLLDFTEQHLVTNIRAGDSKLIKFVLQTKGKNRGYQKNIKIEQQEDIVIRFIDTDQQNDQEEQ